MSHVSPAFIPVFGDCIRMLRKVLYAPKGQPMLIAGSGTLGWDAAAVNLVEPGENVVSIAWSVVALHLVTSPRDFLPDRFSRV